MLLIYYLVDYRYLNLSTKFKWKQNLDLVCLKQLQLTQCQMIPFHSTSKKCLESMNMV